MSKELNKNSQKRKKIFKHAETMSLIISGLNQSERGKYNQITPFTDMLQDNLGNKPHIHTVRDVLTDANLWKEQFKIMDITFFQDKDKFVNGFVIEDKKALDELSKRVTLIEENISKVLDLVEKRLKK